MSLLCILYGGNPLEADLLTVPFCDYASQLVFKSRNMMQYLGASGQWVPESQSIILTIYICFSRGAFVKWCESTELGFNNM